MTYIIIQKTVVQQTVIDTYTGRVTISYMEGKYIIPQEGFAHTSESLDSSVLIHSHALKCMKSCNYMLPTSWEKFGNAPFLFQNASVHITMPIKTWMKAFGVEEIDCSAHRRP